MKNITRTLFLFALSLTIAERAAAQPVITAEPQSRTNNIGDNALFSVTATGTGDLTYQWKFGGGDITGATSSALNVAVADTAVVGTYSVVVTDDDGTTPSSGATLAVPYAAKSIAVQWRFNSAPYTGTGLSSPDIGTGTVGPVGAVLSDSSAPRAGSPSDPASVLGTDNYSRTLTRPLATTENKTAGIQFSASTVGFENLVLTFEQLNTTRNSAYWRTLYTVNGTDWIERGVVDMRAAFLAAGGTSYVYFYDDLTGVEGVAGNPDFAYRVLAEHESTATGSGADAYVPTDPNDTYNATGQPSTRWDMVTILGVETLEHPSITQQPQSQASYVGGTASFTVNATGGNLEYQWRHNTQNIAGATDSSYTRSDLVVSDAGDYSVIVSNSFGFLTSDDAVLTVEADIPPAGDRFWSGNGTLAGGVGTWDTSGANWGTSSEGPFSLPWMNANLDRAIFVGNGSPAGIITVGEPITVNTITVTNSSSSTYTFSGANRISFAGDEPGIYLRGANNTSTTNLINVNTPLGGPVLIKTGAGRVNLNNSGNRVEKWVLRGGVITGTSANAMFGTGYPEEPVEDFITLDGGGLASNGTMTLGVNRGIYLADTIGNKIGVGSGTAVFTIDSKISGPGGISFTPNNTFPGQIHGANGTHVFSNPNNDYQGPTSVAQTQLTLGANEVLPDTTTLRFSGNGRMELNGFTETVTKVVIEGNNARVLDVAGGGQLIADEFELRSGGTTLGVLAGSGSLIKAGSGSIGLGGLNTYTGDTTLQQGTLTLTGAGRFGNGDGTVYLDGGELAIAESRTEETALLNPIVTRGIFVIRPGNAATGNVFLLHSGTWSHQGGDVYLWKDTDIVSASLDLALAGSFDYTGSIDIGSDSSFQLTSYNPAGTDQVFSGGLSGLGTFRRSAGSGGGGRTILNTDNSYSGGTIVEAGTLMVNNESGSGTGSGAVIVAGPSGLLGGTGYISGDVTVNEGGSITAGDGVGTLTLQNGLNLSSSGTYVWELGALKDNSDGTAGTDFDQLVISGAELQLGGSSKLLLEFTGGTTPSASNPFWQATRTWTIINLSGGQNSANAGFAFIANGSQPAGNFSTQVDGSGNITLTFVPGAPAGPVITTHPQSRTAIEGTSTTFTVEATGSNLSYQWFRNNIGNAIAGATTTSYTISNVQLGQADTYFVAVYNSLSSETSSPATLSVVLPPDIESLSGAGTGEVVMTWDTVSGAEYSVQYNTDLSTSNWITLSNFVGAGGSVSVTNAPAPGDPQRFYRLLIE
ncbi:MAG: immunoglobulin domain-containing protein [Verrucomicrobia bacterium]|nr:immunoglobulin domain-containing protein [Verrucomicrobiota bacterium]